MTKYIDEPHNLTCSFCGKSQREVKKLIAGPTVYICDECIELCNEIIAEEYEREEARHRRSKLPKPNEIKELLLGQLTKPVRWEESMGTIREKSIRVFTELGAGRVLTGLMRRIDRGLKVLGVRDLNSLEKTVDHFRANSKIPVTYTRPETAE